MREKHVVKTEQEPAEQSRMGGKQKMMPAYCGVWNEKKRVRLAAAKTPARKSKVMSHDRRTDVSPGKKALLPNARTHCERWDKMSVTERIEWLDDVDKTSADLRSQMQGFAPLWPSPGQTSGSRAEQAHQARRSQRQHDKFVASPTKEGTTLEQMTGGSSSTGIWLRSIDFSVTKANGMLE